MPLLRIIQLSLLALITFAGCLRAEDLTTIEGDTYRGISIKALTSCEVKLIHEGGVVYLATGSLPDEFIKKHHIPVKSCESFAVDREVAQNAANLQAYISGKSKIRLPDGSYTHSGKIIGHTPIRVTFLFESGPKGYDPELLSEELRKAIGYSAAAAKEYRAYLQEQEQAYQQQLAKLRKLREEARKQAEKEKYASMMQELARREQKDKSYSTGKIWVRGYYRKDGTYVRGHFRSR